MPHHILTMKMNIRQQNVNALRQVKVIVKVKVEMMMLAVPSSCHMIVLVPVLVAVFVCVLVLEHVQVGGEGSAPFFLLSQKTVIEIVMEMMMVMVVQCWRTWKVGVMTPPPKKILPFLGTSGMNVPIPTTPLGFIQLFIPREFLVFIMKETNKYATYCRDELKQKSAYEWTGRSLENIAHYIGIRIFMGVCKLPVEQMYWTMNSDYVLFRCQRTMNYNKFKQISRYLHFFR